MSDGTRTDLTVFVPSLARGGAERCAVNLVNEAARRGTAVTLAVAVSGGPLAAEVGAGVEVVELEAGSTTRAVPRLVSHLRHARPHRVLSLLTHANVVALTAAAVVGRRGDVFVWEHNTMSQTLARSELWRDHVAVRLARRLYPSAGGVLAVSQGVARDLGTVLRLARTVQVVPNPVLGPVAAESDPGRLLPGFVDERPRIVALGRLVEQKDFTLLVAAFASIADRTPAALWILGDGPLRGSLLAQVADAGLVGRVHLPGGVPNPLDHLQAADLVVSSSRYEGLPTVLIEAMSLGRPIVATDAPHGPRELLADGRWGRLVPVGDATMLGRAMLDGLAGEVSAAPASAWERYRVRTAVPAVLDAIGLP